jgi:hypothetical protein
MGVLGINHIARHEDELAFDLDRDGFEQVGCWR